MRRTMMKVMRDELGSVHKLERAASMRVKLELKT